ncbi:hypothetical protein CAEBREN_16789 [Caenorhabditis brenneri]|uniref:Uncharacterized protein n=1 Tax=Caenorhabditis brenneri TaxID=135651 RepID=G0NN22_CAEBE|nr:hypothetical protein CAEBREN_16789 [Caenorhabditis brenneri]
MSCIISDLNISLFMQPIGLFPLPSGYSCGIGRSAFRLTTHIHMTIFTFLLSGQIEVLTICFLRKHKAIMDLSSIQKSSDIKYFCIYFMCISYSCLIALSIFVSSESKEDQLRYVDQHFPSMSQKFRALDEFQFYMHNNRMMVFYILVFGGTTKTAIVVSSLSTVVSSIRFSDNVLTR